MKIPPCWRVPAFDPAPAARLAEALGLPMAIASVLVRRGLNDPDEARRFLAADPADLENPFAMAGMEEAVARLRAAVEARETVFVHGDRDVDGVTSTALLVSLLERLGLARAWHVPGEGDGYGLTPRAVDRAAAAGATLLLAVDCGIRDFAGAAAARAAGIDLVILDHHEPADRLPDAAAVVDPRRADCAYPWKGLSACGVAFKFAQAVLLSDDEFFRTPVVVFDVETTGMTPTDEIIEIGAVKAVHGRIVDRFVSYIRPERNRISDEITGITGIRWDDVRDAPPAREVVPRFLDWAGDCALGAHNLPFDMRFLEPVARAVGRAVPRRTFDTLALAREHFPDRSHKLEEMAESLGIALDRAHRAADDAEAALALMKRIVVRRNPAAQAFLKAHVDLAALSTIADYVPMRGENRAIVRLGARALADPVRPGLAALYEAVFPRRETGGLLERIKRSVAGAPPRAAALKDVAWTVAPALNAPGRMGRPEVAVRLLLAESLPAARPLAAEVVRMNAERKDRTDENYRAVVESLEAAFDPARDRLVFGAAATHGVSGIVANRLVRDLGRPVVVYVPGAGEVIGTLRGVEGFDAVAALDSCRALLVRYGGHKGAAGFTVRAENLEALRAGLEEAAAAMLPADAAAIRPTLEIDALVGPEDLRPDLLRAIDLLAPFGPENEPPVFGALGCRVVEARGVGADGRHLSLVLDLGGAEVRAVGWGMGPGAPGAPPPPRPGDSIDAAFAVEEDSWKGGGAIQWVLESWRPHGVGSGA